MQYYYLYFLHFHGSKKPIFALFLRFFEYFVYVVSIGRGECLGLWKKEGACCGNTRPDKQPGGIKACYIHFAPKGPPGLMN